MRLILSAFDPRRIAGQISTVIVLAAVLVYCVALLTFMLLPSGGGGEPRYGRPVQDRLAALIRLVGAAPAGPARQDVIEAANEAFPNFELALGTGTAVARVPDELQPGLNHIRRRLGPDYPIHLAENGPARSPQSRVVAKLLDGAALTASIDLRDPHPPFLNMMLIGSLGFVVLSVGLLSLWAARALASPLTRFAAAAEGFSLDADSPALKEEGPAEIRVVSRALNRMRERIRRMAEDRTRMLAAVSHDLRTPITRLRLRAEFVPDETIRGPMLRDLDQMNAMISGALSHLREGKSGESEEKVDLSALLTTITDDFCDIGHNVTYAGPARVVVMGRSDELTRAITNLVENAIKYGGEVALRLRAFPGVVEIDVEDHGAGIPAEMRDAMMRPFARGDAARNLNHPAGFGLGLSIAKSVAEGHGGTLTLLEAEPTGLIARMTLPVPPVEGRPGEHAPSLAATPTKTIAQHSAT